MDFYCKQTSLRDIKKEKTSNDLADAAFELALERGMDGFVVDDIVQQAGYSRRTFANYFSCKEEAVVTVALNQKGASKVADFILEIDKKTPPIDVLYQLMKMQFTTNLLKKLRQLVDRKSTRLNSSHVAISYAVFCLKKKTLITSPQS